MYLSQHDRSKLGKCWEICLNRKTERNVLDLNKIVNFWICPWPIILDTIITIFVFWSNQTYFGILSHSMVLEMLTFFGVWQTQPWRSSHFFFKEPVRACLRIFFCFLYKLFHRMASPNAVVVNDQSGHWWWVGGACLGPIICPYNTDKDQNVSQGWNHTCIDCVRVLVRVR